MPRIRLTQPGFTTLTGSLHNIAFVGGVSADLPQNIADRIGANIQANEVASDGTTVLRAAGAASGLKSVQPVVALADIIEPSTPAALNGVTTIALTQAEYDALATVDPAVAYLIKE